VVTLTIRSLEFNLLHDMSWDDIMEEVISLSFLSLRLPVNKTNTKGVTQTVTGGVTQTIIPVLTQSITGVCLKPSQGCDTNYRDVIVGTITELTPLQGTVT